MILLTPRRLFSATAFTLTTTTFSPLFGAGYAIAEQSVSGLGQGYAGAAALAEDASTIWHNPAGMMLLGDSPTISAGVHVIVPTADFKNTGSLTIDATGTGFVPTQGADDSSNNVAVVPNFAYAHPIGEDLALGLAINVPFGLRTEYSDNWVGRYVALETDLKTININPSFAYRISDKLSIGGGVNLVTADAVLSNAIDFGLITLSNANSNPVFGAAAAPLLPDIAANRGGTKYDGHIELTGDDIGYGYNFGVLYSVTETTRIGVHYRSEIDLTLEGKANFTVPTVLDPLLGATFSDQGGSVDLTLPASLSISLVTELTPKLTLLLDYTWTDWSVFDELFVKYDGTLAGSSVESPIPENWDDTSRYSVGLNYQLNDEFKLRAGLVLDEAAVPSPEFRSPRIPDAERIWLALGLQWSMSEHIVIDFAYTHVFVDDATTNNSAHTTGQVLIGDNEAAVDIFSIGGTYRF